MAKVTEVRVRKYYEEGKVKAILSATLDDQFVVHGIKVLENDEGLFVAMPSKRLKTGNFKDVFHPINSDARDDLEKDILGRFDAAKELFISEINTDVLNED